MDYAQARANMVECQIRPSNVTDGLVVAALSELPRESFVPARLKDVAYVDEALALDGGRHVMEPMVLARLLQTATVGADDLALVVGAGSGYEAAALAKLASTVVALENDSAVAAKAGEALSGLGIDTVAVVEGDLAAGYPDQAPYDVIFINGAVPSVPSALADQLAEGGRLVAIVTEGVASHAVCITRTDGVLSSRNVFDAGTPPLSGFETAGGFRF